MRPLLLVGGTHDRSARRRGPATVALALTVVVVTMLTAAPASSAPAQDADPAPPTTTSTTTPPTTVASAPAPGPAPVPTPTPTTPARTSGVVDDRISPELATVPTHSSNYEVALARLRATEANLQVALEAQTRAERTLLALGETEVRLTVQLQAASVQRESAARRVDEIRAGLRQLAVEAYVDGGEGETLQNIDVDAAGELEREADRALVDTVTDHHREDYTANVARRDAAAREIERTVLLLDSVRSRTDEVTGARDAAVESAALLTLRAEDERQAVADARVTAQVVGADFPLVALDAFWKASAIVNLLIPDCGMRWTVLAGISRVEGVHGTWGGSQLDGDGNTTERITGPPLNGERNTAVVRDSDGGVWDDDTVWDRGVGPMGFIPSSWRIFGGDGNGDGVFDPHNIYDATVASGKLLCYSNRHMDQEESLRAALFRYNRSQRYVDIVVGHIRGYDALNYPPPV